MRAFVSAEQPGAVLLHGRAHRAAILVLDQQRLVAGLREEVRGVQPVVAQEIVGRTVPLVGAAARNRTDNGAGRCAEFSRVVAGLDLEFAERVDGRTQHVEASIEQRGSKRPVPSVTHGNRR